MEKLPTLYNLYESLRLNGYSAFEIKDRNMILNINGPKTYDSFEERYENNIDHEFYESERNIRICREEMEELKKELDYQIIMHNAYDEARKRYIAEKVSKYYHFCEYNI